MATGLQQWALGVDTGIVITPQTLTPNTGLFADDTTLGAVSFYGRIDESDEEISYQMDDISPIGAFNSNPVIYQQSGNYNIVEIEAAFPLVASGNLGFGRGNILRKCYRISQYHKLAITLLKKDGTTAIETTTVFVIMGQPRRISRPKNKTTNRASFSLISVWDSATGFEIVNPAYS